MDRVPPNARHLPSAVIDVDQPVFNDDDTSVCGVVFITSEGGAYNPKFSQTSKLSQQQNAEPYGQPWAVQTSKGISNKMLLLLVLGLAALLGISIGIAVGVGRQKQQQQDQRGKQTQQDLPGPKAAGAMLASLPFTALATVTAPAGAADYTCDAMFSTDQVIQIVVNQLQSAYTTQLASLGIDSVNVTKLSCNGATYSLQQSAQWDNWPMAAALAPAAAAAAATAGIQLHERATSSSIWGPMHFELAVNLEMYKRLYVDDIRAPTDDTWMSEARQEAAAATAVILPKIMADILSVTLSDGSLQVRQLPTITITSSAAVTNTVSGSSPKVPAIEVTRTRTDAITGLVLDTQTIIVNQPFHGTADTGGSSSSSDSSEPLPANSTSTGTGTGSGADAQSTPAPSSTGGSSSGSTSGSNATPPTGGSSSSSGGTQDTISSKMPQPPSADQPEPSSEAQTCQAGDNCALPHAMSACLSSKCTVYSCLPGWQDCDGLVGNGCEADTLKFFTDSRHCGGCGKICLAPLTCVDGKCSLAAPVESPATATKPLPPTTDPQGQQQQQHPPSGTAALPPAIEPPSDSDTQVPLDSAEPKPPVEWPPAAVDLPTDVEPSTPPAASETPAAEEPSSGAAAAPKPSVPAAPRPSPEVRVMPLLYDDYVRISPAQRRITIDVLINDNLGGYSAKDVAISIVAVPEAGTATVLPAAVVLPATSRSAGSTMLASSTTNRQTILYIQPPNSRLAAGQEVTLYYTVSVPGQPTPAPAAVTLIGAVAEPSPSLLSCGPSSTELPGTVLLSRADDAAVQVSLPFAMPLYGDKYNTAIVSSNGWISFGDSGAKEPCNVQTAWPGGQCLGTGPVMAVFWDDLLPDSVLSYQDKQLGAFVIQWTNVMFPSSPIPLGTFQAYLFQNGSIGYVYRDLFGSDQGLGSSAVIGIRSPTTNGKQLQRLLERMTGEHSDPHGMWFYAAGLSDPDYVMTLSAQRRFLNPGLALISHPQKSSSTVGSTARTGSSVPGKFQVWTAAAAGSSLRRSLVAPGSPARPTLEKPTTAAVAPNSSSSSAASSGAAVVTLSWSVPLELPAVQQYRLFVAADSMLSELVRQPAGEAFSPADIPGSTASVDVVLGSRFLEADIYVLLLACNNATCSASCLQQFQLSSGLSAPLASR